MRINSPRDRKAISPVLATVILIAITLIAAIAIAGFVFGLFGSFTSSAQVTVQVTRCIATTANSTNACIVTLRNTGTANVAVNTCSIQVGGAATAGTLKPTVPFTVSASGSRVAVCTAAGTAQTVGAQAVGSFSLSNGASVPFSGVWS